MAEKATAECLQCLNKALEITANFIPLAESCCGAGLEADEMLAHLKAVQAKAAALKAKLFPQER